MFVAIDRTSKSAFVELHERARQQFRRLSAYNFGRRLKTLKGLTPYEHIYKTWTQQPD